MTGFDSPIPPALASLWAALLLAALGWGLWRFRHVVSVSYLLWLLLLRLCAAIVVLIILLQPFREVARPDPESFRIAVLADTSQSMSVRDLPGQALKAMWLFLQRHLAEIEVTA